MNYSINIIDEHYRIPKRFHVHVPDLYNYLLKIIGIDNGEKKKENYTRKPDLAERRCKSLKTMLLYHLFRKLKKDLNNKPQKHESP